jgi:hypothetical protein
MNSGGNFLAVYSKVKEQQEGAYKFMEFLTSREAFEIWLATGYLNVTTNDIPIRPGNEAAQAQMEGGLTSETVWPGARGLEALTVPIDWITKMRCRCPTAAGGAARRSRLVAARRRLAAPPQSPWLFADLPSPPHRLRLAAHGLDPALSFFDWSPLKQEGTWRFPHIAAPWQTPIPLAFVNTGSICSPAAAGRRSALAFALVRMRAKTAKLYRTCSRRPCFLPGRRGGCGRLQSDRLSQHATGMGACRAG